MNNSNITKGHDHVHGGLRGHSIGQFYPFSVYHMGTLEDGNWCVMHCLDSTFEHEICDSLDIAHDRAITLYNIFYSQEYKAQNSLFNKLTGGQYSFNNILNEIDNSDFLLVYKTDDCLYYAPNNEDFSSIVAIDRVNQLAKFTGFYETADFEPVTIHGKTYESDYALRCHQGILKPDFEIV
tara:strand:+ start:541 stop:1083 length:543 start_codon:yes stop_codon:yes gene_type:complete